MRRRRTAASGPGIRPGAPPVIHSAACEYAIRAAAHLASRNPDEPVKLREIARLEDIPRPFLSALLPRLVTAGLMDSTRGPTGGYVLSRAPDRIRLHDIVVAVDGLDALERCAAGLGRCSDLVPCPLHDAWKPIRERVRGYLRQTTLADMARAIEVKRSRMEGSPGRAVPS
ncbi:MAG: Rrf2 family transcriptional regulator [Gemmatimonadales bacterium]|nr:MAG: Rrf2 family transcriptional regulator [Gemmatimonadales bacterium]